MKALVDEPMAKRVWEVTGLSPSTSRLPKPLRVNHLVVDDDSDRRPGDVPILQGLVNEVVESIEGNLGGGGAVQPPLDREGDRLSALREVAGYSFAIVGKRPLECRAAGDAGLVRQFEPDSPVLEGDVGEGKVLDFLDGDGDVAFPGIAFRTEAEVDLQLRAGDLDRAFPAAFKGSALWFRCGRSRSA